MSKKPFSLFERFKNYWGSILFPAKDKQDDFSADVEIGLDYFDSQKSEESRQAFLEKNLNRMRELTLGIAEMKSEHAAITSHINDLRTIDNLPEQIRLSLNEYASNIVTIEKMRAQYGGRSSLLPESVYRKMDSITELMPEGIDKLAEQEDLHRKIQYDMENLHSQREAIDYRFHEASTSIANIRGIAIISSIGAVFCIIILLILQLGFKKDAQIGYIIMAAILAVTMFTLFTRRNNLESELATIGLTEEKLIKIQNQVKIRYVNSVNLLDFYYTKYHSNSSKTLKKDWDNYTKEAAERKHQEKISAELEVNKASLLDILKQARVLNALAFINQPSAFIDSAEYEQMKHSVMTDRENLRRQIGGMEKNLELVKNEIIEFANKHPEYEREILNAIAQMSLPS